MPEYTLTLTAAEDLALTHWLERLNAERATQRDEQEQPLPPWTAQDVLHWAVRNDLQNRARELQDSTQEWFEVLKEITPAQRTAVLAKWADGPRKQWLQGRIAQGS